MPSSAPSHNLKLSLHKDVPLSKYATLQIGGPARYLTHVTTIEEAREALHFATLENLPFFVVGKGSNCLFDDRGFAGLVIVNKIHDFAFDDDLVRVGGGYNFSLLGAQTARKGFTGLEFASGIPGTVGGAIYMNAGAGGFETKDTLVDVLFLTKEGEERLYKKEELAFSYRTSPFQKMEGMIIGATFRLQEDPSAKARQIEMVNYRTSTQPYGEKSAGCVFRNPTCKGAGATIDACGLKGVTIGGAAVSSVHANFLINKNGASASDFLALIKHVQKTVFEKTGETLEMEIRKVPYDIPR